MVARVGQLPGMAGHEIGVGVRAGFPDAEQRGLWLSGLLEHGAAQQPRIMEEKAPEVLV